ncbi:Fur family transcriptional regulator [Microbacterium sp. X-17]|uniref:Fur family transcriptional regulator n=1 Tax=Microbacterium sp. X-17 TaxID=3144404 RepID=UPI0031F504DA
MPAVAPELPAEGAIRGAGLRATDSRRAVYDALRGMPHATADLVFAAVVESVPGTSLQSIYNALGDFTRAGLVRRIEPAGHPGMYELRVDDNHHHLVCAICGAVEDVDCAVGAAPCLTPSETRGFVVDEAEVVYWGRCATCVAAEASLSPALHTPIIRNPVHTPQKGSAHDRV